MYIPVMVEGKQHPKKEDIDHVIEGLNFAKELIMRGEYDSR